MAQFPTNNYDSTHGGVDENNNPNTSEIANANKGKERTGDTLYSDKHYLDGDGFLYGLGMASQRMIVKGKCDDIDTNHFAWTSASTTGKLILRVDNLVSGGLVTANNGNRLAVNPGNGLYIDTINQNKLAVSLFKKQKTPQSTPYNVSGLEFATGAEWGGAPAAGQLRIKLADLSMDGTNFDNVSGLILQEPYDTGSGATQFHGNGGLKVNYGDGLTLDNSLKLTTALYTKKSGNKNESGLIIQEDSSTYSSGLKINTGKALYIGSDSTDTAAYGKLNVLYDNITIKLDSQGRLKVNDAAIVPNISGTNPIEVTTSGNNKTIGLKLKNTTESGQTIYSSGLDADSGGLFVKLGDNSIANGNNGLYVDWAIAPWGVGLEYVSGNIKVKPATTSEIGGVKLGTDTAPEVGMDSSTHYLLKDDSDAAYVNAYVYNSYPTTNAAEHYPYSAAYIISNYSTNTQIDTKIATAISDISGREYKIFPTLLPTKGESQSWADFYAAYKKYIALVSNTGSAPDAYKEYILIVTNESTGECHWEQIGDTEFTTDNFVAKTDVLTQAEVASIVQDVFGF